MRVKFFERAFPNMGKDFQNILDSGFLTSGEIGKRVEGEIVSFFGVKGCLLTNSWTNAALCTLRALGVGEGDEVIVPAITFVATANVVKLLGATPIFADIDLLDGNIALDELEPLISKKTKAIIAVHMYGKMVDLKKLSVLCENYSIYLIEDAAHCFEGTRGGYKPGTHSDAAIFSFYATKNITCGEGGAIISNNSSLLEKIRKLRLHGMSAGAAERYSNKYYVHYDVQEPGFKANLPDIQAFMLSHQIKEVEINRIKREAVAQKYSKLIRLSDISKKIFLPAEPNLNENINHAYHLFPILVNEEIRDKLIHFMNENEIGVAVNFRSLTELSAYKSNKCPKALEFGRRVISLPFYPELELKKIEYVITILQKGIENA